MKIHLRNFASDLNLSPQRQHMTEMAATGSRNPPATVMSPNTWNAIYPLRMKISLRNFAHTFDWKLQSHHIIKLALTRRRKATAVMTSSTNTDAICALCLEIPPRTCTRCLTWGALWGKWSKAHYEEIGGAGHDCDVTSSFACTNAIAVQLKPEDGVE